MSNRAEREFDAAVVHGARDAGPVDDTTVTFAFDVGSRLDRWGQRLLSTPQRIRLWHWGAPVFVGVVAAITRLVDLGHPQSLVFDETFYVKDAWTQWQLGYPASWPENADASVNAGNLSGYLTDPSFVVHPPLGKWLIGVGMALFGPSDSWTWRISTAIVGILAVILLMLIAKKLFNSTLLAAIAGFLFAIDGQAIVMSRVALLDNYVMFFALCGFGAILLDRDWTTRRVERWMARRRGDNHGTDWGPTLWWRPWLTTAAVTFGLTSACKWNGLYFLAFFVIYTLVVDGAIRHRSGIAFWGTGTVLKQTVPTFLITIPIALVAYLSTWVSWFTSANSYYRHWANDEGNAWQGILAWVPHSIQSFWHFEVAVYNYNIGEMRPHAYQANPLTWLLMIRPTSMYYLGSNPGQNGCGTGYCGESITELANPLIWWAATVAVLYLVYRLVRYREWRVGLVLTGVGAGYLPWLLYLNRTVFQFYTIAFEPYLILALTLVIGIVLGKPTDAAWRRENDIRFVAIFLALALALSIFFWPLWTGTQIDYNYLRAHWWLPTWR